MPRRTTRTIRTEENISMDLEGLLTLMQAFARGSTIPMNEPSQPRAQRNRRRRSNTVRRITRRAFSQNPSRILDELRENNQNAIVLNGLDNALIGISERGLAVYEKNLIIDILMTRDSMSYEDAVEFYDYNIAGLGGENMPVLVDLGWSGSEESIADNNEPSKQKKDSKKTQPDNQTNPVQDGPIESLEL